MMNVGISTACFFGRVYNEAALREIGRLGVREAEIFFSAQMEYRPPFVRELVRICEAEDIRMVSVHALPTQFEPQLFSSHGRQYEEALGVFDQVLDAANMLGAGIYVFHGPVHLKIAKKLKLDMGFAGDRVSVLAERAKARGVALCYENVHWCWYNMPGFSRELSARVDSDNLFFTLDMKQAAQSGYSVFDYMDDMGGRMKHVHICDYRKHPENGVLPCLPFEGETDWETVRQRLADMRYEGVLMLEVYANDYTGYAGLQDCYERVGAFFR